uniref:EGF-like domain-containing protein n=1 Tax=Paramormyrops kingsleyae TaxID=1676925 RepID=A0A3B3RHE8_9TELE
MTDFPLRGQMVCDTEASTHWLLVPQTLEVRWTLSRKTCSSPEECWGIRGHGHEEELSSTLWTFPQMCPVQLQVGDKLLVLADDTLESYGIHLMNVSKESFRSCSTTGYPADQLLFPGHVKGTVEVDPKWLLPGTQHLVAVREGDPELCKVGLRLVVRVRGHRCRRTTSERLCAGNGACRAAVQDNMFNCACRRGFSGRFCERFGGRPSGRHGARSLCMRRGPAYECVCPSRPAGKVVPQTIRALCHSFCIYVKPSSFIKLKPRDRIRRCERGQILIVYFSLLITAFPYLAHCSYFRKLIPQRLFIQATVFVLSL